MEQWPLTPDIIETIQTMDAMDLPEDEEDCIIFNPATFTQDNTELSLEEFRLDEEALKEWAITVTEIRRTFKEKAADLGTNEIANDDEDTGRTRRGLKLSVASRNPKG